MVIEEKLIRKYGVCLLCRLHIARRPQNHFSKRKAINICGQTGEVLNKFRYGCENFEHNFRELPYIGPNIFEILLDDKQYTINDILQGDNNAAGKRAN